MLLGGLWHGAAWTFVLWGLIHGFYLILERWLKSLTLSKQIGQIAVTKIVMMFVTFFLVMLAFVIFRAENLDQAHSIFSGMFMTVQGQELIKWNLWTQIVSASFLIMFALQWIYKNTKITDILQSHSIVVRSLILSFCLILIFISAGNSDAFIYFQF